MRRTKRMFLAGLLSLSALVPVVALAAPTTEYVAGAEYALGTCAGGSTGSFAGYGSATPGGPANAAFNTTICHSPLIEGKASILDGGSFTLAMSELTLVGRYVSGKVVSLRVTGGYFCKEVFSVTAELGPASSVPEDAISITGGSVPIGWLTHYGVRNGTGCKAYAASITGVAMLNYLTDHA